MSNPQLSFSHGLTRTDTDKRGFSIQGLQVRAGPNQPMAEKTTAGGLASFCRNFYVFLYK